MKRLIQTSACLSLALGCLSLPAPGQAQNDALAAPDLGPVLERLDQVIAGLAKVSGDLAKLQKASSSNAKDKSLKTATKQLTDLNTAVESLASQFAGQAKAAGKQADSAVEAANLLKRWSPCKPPPRPKPGGRLRSPSGSTNQFLATAASRSRRR